MDDVKKEIFDLLNQLSSKICDEKSKERLCSLIPCIRNIQNLEHENPAHKYDVLEHTLHVVAKMEDYNDEKKNTIARLSALFHDVGKALTKKLGTDNIYHYKDHDKFSSLIAKDALTKLGYDEEIVKVVTAMCLWHDTNLKYYGRIFFEKFLNEIGKENLEIFCNLQIADLSSHADWYYKKWLDSCNENIVWMKEKAKI